MRTTATVVPAAVTATEDDVKDEDDVDNGCNCSCSHQCHLQLNDVRAGIMIFSFILFTNYTNLGCTEW